MKRAIILKAIISLLGSSFIHIHSMNELPTKELFIEQLHQACTNNDKNCVKKLLKQLNTYDYADDVKNNDLQKKKSEKNSEKPSKLIYQNALNIICKKLNKNPQDDCVRYNAKRILAHLLYNNFNPNIQGKHGNTPLHILEPLNTNVEALELLLDRGANPHIKNNVKKDSYELACGIVSEQDYLSTIKQAYYRWQNLEVPNLKNWQEDNHRPTAIRKRYRFLFDGADEKELQNSDGRIVFVIVHGTGITGESGTCNKDYYHPENSRFQSFMDYAKTYAQEHNRIHEHELKVLHLISFLWNGNLLDATSRKPAGIWLGDYLESWNYRTSKIVCIGHSHGCNVINFASHNLRLLRRKSDGLYEGRIKELIFFAPPCKQKISPEEKSSYMNFFGKVFDKFNDIMSVTPTNYDQLFVFHSPHDMTVNLGSIDALTGIGVAATFGIDACIVKKLIELSMSKNLVVSIDHVIIEMCKKLIKEGVPSAELGGKLICEIFKLCAPSLVGHSFYAACNALAKKVKHSHTYNLSIPKNECNKVKGPKVHIETMVNGNYIGHSSPELLENFAIALKILKTQYMLNISRCENFKINITTKNGIQESLLRCIEHQDYTALFDNFEDDDKNDQRNALLAFWQNRQDNCKIQCRISKDENRNRETIFDELNRSKYYKNTIKKLKAIYGEELDSTNCINRSLLISDKHQLAYEHYSSELQENSNNGSSISCNLL